MRARLSCMNLAEATTKMIFLLHVLLLGEPTVVHLTESYKFTTCTQAKYVLVVVSRPLLFLSCREYILRPIARDSALNAANSVICVLVLSYFLLFFVSQKKKRNKKVHTTQHKTDKKKERNNTKREVSVGQFGCYFPLLSQTYISIFRFRFVLIR